jgi:hypothetical protein
VIDIATNFMEQIISTLIDAASQQTSMGAPQQKERHIASCELAMPAMRIKRAIAKRNILSLQTPRGQQQKPVCASSKRASHKLKLA